MTMKSILCVDVGGTRIKYAVLPQKSKLENISSSKLFNLRTLGWLNDSFSNLFSKHHWASVISKNSISNYTDIAVSVPGPISEGKYFKRNDLIDRGMPKNLKESIQKSSDMPVTLIKDADAWAIGVAKYLKLKKSDVNFPILVLAFGTGVGASIIKSPSEFYSIEISKAPCKFIHLSNKSGNSVDQSWKVHNRIGNHFFEWVSKDRPNWSYDKIRSEFTKRVSAFILDMRNILPGDLNKFETVVLGGGNSEYVSVTEVKNDSGKNVITFWNRHLEINPDFIPLLGLSHIQSNINIHKSPW
jgi:ROK family